MDGELRQALEHARGESGYIFAVVADIRGFSTFSQRHESPDVATYVKRVYIRLIDDYFPFATFYKATGDGLLMAVPFESENLAEMAQRTIAGCLRCLDEFGTICCNDPMVNFETPDKIGFGIARGTACCLTSDGTILDYSGHLINLASRLMDLARPSGVVLDGALGIGLLDADTQALFVSEQVFVRSVAESESTTVYVLKGVVQIEEETRRPIARETWQEARESRTFRKWREVTPRFRIKLEKRLRRSDAIRASLVLPVRRAGKRVENVENETALDNEECEYEVRGNDQWVLVHVDRLLDYRKKKRLRLDDTATVRIAYVPE